jgi:hypothetical protein
MPGFVAQKPTWPLFRLFVAIDCFVETWLTTDSFGAPIPNSSIWSSKASWHPKVLVRNLTVEVSSNQAAAKLLVMDAGNVPNADIRYERL